MCEETYLFISRFGFKSGICLLIAPVPVHCFSITSTKGQYPEVTKERFSHNRAQILKCHNGRFHFKISF